MDVRDTHTLRATTLAVLKPAPSTSLHAGVEQDLGRLGHAYRGEWRGPPMQPHVQKQTFITLHACMDSSYVTAGRAQASSGRGSLLRIRALLPRSTPSPRSASAACPSQLLLPSATVDPGDCCPRLPTATASMTPAAA
jgi:hypothetical protein